MEYNSNTKRYPSICIGIDEVGRGCWAGPLLAAAVVLNPEAPITGLTDSKLISRHRREQLAPLIQAQSLASGIGWVWPADIDRHGLTWAVAAAMESALLQVTAQLADDAVVDIIIDGSYNFLPAYDGVRTLIGADKIEPAVSAASILAKVVRDQYMCQVAAAEYPAHGFERHVGYGTKQHIAALEAHGVTNLHRRSYKPVMRILAS